MSHWAFDIEVYPNLFSISLFNLESKDTPKEVSKGLGLNHSDVKCFVYSEDFGIDQLSEMKDFLLSQKVTLVGFNNLYYDTPVIDYILYENPTNQDIFEYSTSLISRLNSGIGAVVERNYQWDEIDLMKLYAFDALGVSLKQISINLQWHRVQDLPFQFDQKIREEDLSTILDYNLNDVLITSDLYFRSHAEINLRRNLSVAYNLDLRSASDSRMANLMLNDIYSKKTGLPIQAFRNNRTERHLVWLRNCIGKNISFKTKKLQELLRKVMTSVVVKENNFAFSEKIEFGNCVYEIGVGGLHSVDSAYSFYSDNTYTIQDADVASFYPNIMLLNNVIPNHLDNNFIEILKDITNERIEAKRTGNKVKAEGLKITINSIFGKLNSDTFWLQDAKSMLTVTLSGQLYLLMLIEDLMLNGIMTISANTDGIVCRIPKNLESKYYEVCNAWQKRTGFELEYTSYAEYHRVDVNNYITKKADGTTKEKGRLLQEISLKKGYRYPIVSRAIYQYLIDGIPVIDTLKKCDNILDFCISQKAGGAFKMELESDGEFQSLQKNNRFYVSESGGTLIKRNKATDKTIGLLVGESVIILNDYDENQTISSYPIKYSFYEEECYKYIKEIEEGTFNFDFISEELGNDILDTSTLGEADENIPILPPKFRVSKGTYRYDEGENVIYRGIADINYLTDETGEILYSKRDSHYESFLDFLIENKTEMNLNKRQMEILIKVNFFSEFGKNKKLLEFYTEFDKIYKVGQTEKTTTKKLEILKTLWNTLEDKSFPIIEQINTEIEIFGFVQTKFNVDKNLFYVLDVNTTYSPKLKVLLLQEGKVKEVKIQKKLYDIVHFKVDGKPQRTVQSGDFLWCSDISKEPAVRKGGDGEEEWVIIEGKYTWWIRDYSIVNPEKIKL